MPDADRDWSLVPLEPGFTPIPGWPPLRWRLVDGTFFIEGAVKAPEGVKDGDLVGVLPVGISRRLSPERMRVSLKEGDDGGVEWTGYSVETDGRILCWPTVPEGYESWL